MHLAWGAVGGSNKEMPKSEPVFAGALEKMSDCRAGENSSAQ